jgi:hypothetical protein
MYFMHGRLAAAQTSGLTLLCQVACRSIIIIAAKLPLQFSDCMHVYFMHGPLTPAQGLRSAFCQLVQV